MKIQKQKVNIYSKTQLVVLKQQLRGMAQHLDSFDMKSLEDKIITKYTIAGPVPSIISSIEDQIKTALSTVKQSINIIISIYENEGLSDELQNSIDITVTKLEEIKNHYFNMNIPSIIDRIHTVQIQTKRSVKPLTLIGATKEKIIESKNKFTKEILEILPQIDIVSSYNKVTTRGGIEIGENMERFLLRRNNNNANSEYNVYR